MASEFPRSPAIMKGALVVFETKVPVPTNVIVFQYNPDAMSRSFTPHTQTTRAQNTSGDTRRVLYPPTESFNVEVELDAADQLADNNALARATGLHPTLAALELLLYPPSAQVIFGKVLAELGSAMVSPMNTPLVILVWGPLRVVPVRVTQVGITEQAFDTLLNPIRAKVTLGMSTLTQRELSVAGAPFDTLALVQLIAKEVLAKLNIVNSVSTVTAELSF